MGIRPLGTIFLDEGAGFLHDRENRAESVTMSLWNVSVTGVSGPDEEIFAFEIFAPHG